VASVYSKPVFACDEDVLECSTLLLAWFSPQ
jgi:hypothetical protein